MVRFGVQEMTRGRSQGLVTERVKRQFDARSRGFKQERVKFIRGNPSMITRGPVG